MKRLLLLALLLAPSSAFAGIYDIKCTSSCIASDGTTQPTNTILNLIQWNGTSPYTPTDGAGNTADVALVSDPGGTGIVYIPPNLATVPSQSETDCPVTNAGSCTLPAGTGLSQWTGSGTAASFTVSLPPRPIVGPQSFIQINALGTFTITSLTVKDGSGTTLATVTLTAPKVVRAIYTSTGWAVLPN